MDSPIISTADTMTTAQILPHQPKEIIVLQVGQCGNQIGRSFWNRLVQEHRTSLVDDISNVNADDDDKNNKLLSTRTFFEMTNEAFAKPRWRARAILVDSEEGVISETLRSPLGRLLYRSATHTHLLSSSGAGNNFACGRHLFRGSSDSLAELIRRRVERCEGNTTPSFITMHSLTGGTGSGCGTALMEALRDDYPKWGRWNLGVSCGDDVVVSPYNSMLALGSLRTAADVVMTLDNQRLVDWEKRRRWREPLEEVTENFDVILRDDRKCGRKRRPSVVAGGSKSKTEGQARQRYGVAQVGASFREENQRKPSISNNKNKIQRRSIKSRKSMENKKLVNNSRENNNAKRNQSYADTNSNTNTTNVKRIGYSHLNESVSELLSHLTSGTRFPKTTASTTTSGGADLDDIKTTLIPSNDFNFIVPHFTAPHPQSSDSGGGHNAVVTTNDRINFEKQKSTYRKQLRVLFRDAFGRPSSSMVYHRPITSYYTVRCHMIVRTGDCILRPIPHNLPPGGDFAWPLIREEAHRWGSMLHLPSVENTFTMSLYKKSYGSSVTTATAAKSTATSLLNSSCILDSLDQLDRRYETLFRRRAMIHHYREWGYEDDCFREARESVGCVMESYRAAASQNLP